ncbi:HNH endonuclease signature motif containing protein [Gordonia malaquae]|uniref:HNH endonuclease n=1 Tax=Gordonia malaquae TaxID=410332 RepID=UPI0030FE8913
MQATLDHYGDVCHLCGAAGADSADHIIPRERGGPDTLDNLRPVHHSAGPRCNRHRLHMTLDEWRRRHGPPVAARELEPSRKW